MKDFLTYRLEEKDENKNKIPDFIFKWLSVVSGYKFKKIYVGDSDIYYGNQPGNSRINVISNPTDVLWCDLVNGNAGLNNIINFDIINAITYFVSDKVNSKAPLTAYDSHSR